MNPIGSESYNPSNNNEVLRFPPVQIFEPEDYLATCLNATHSFKSKRKFLSLCIAIDDSLRYSFFSDNDNFVSSISRDSDLF